MTLEQQILQNLVSGITNGAIYALIALGFVAVYSVTGIIHFAQGEFVMLGALLAVSLHRAGLPLAAAGAAAVAGAAVISGVFYRTAIYPARWASVLTLIIITIGGALTVRGVALVLWGTFSYSLPAFTPGLPLRVAGAVIRLQSLWVVGSLLVTMVLLYLFFEHTVAGKALRACAVNMFAARLMGIHPPRAALAAFVLSGALGALAG
ncbi:MAG: branched-chain amino acid ABC transporter permease, partial [Armatimonadetes bacterium]|nr:branched-chain amino acid ABC transporter permease [Armatimonadota bacterium]